MLHLGDTNILLRYPRPTGNVSTLVRDAVRRMTKRGDTFCATTQNYVEFWNVATRPIGKNGFGRTPAEAARLLVSVERTFPFIPDSPAVFPEWRRLVKKYAVSGV